MTARIEPGSADDRRNGSSRGRARQSPARRVCLATRGAFSEFHRTHGSLKDFRSGVSKKFSGLSEEEFTASPGCWSAHPGRRAIPLWHKICNRIWIAVVELRHK